MTSTQLRTMPRLPGRRRRCPVCGREIVFDDANLTISHAVPVCKKFKEILATKRPDQISMSDDSDDDTKN